MLVNLKNMEEKEIPNFKGGEKSFNVKMFTNDKVKIMRGRLTPGSSIGLHTHMGNSEIVYIIEGNGKVLYDGEYIKLTAGDCHYCPEGHEHSLINDSENDLIFFAVVPKQ